MIYSNFYYQSSVSVVSINFAIVQECLSVQYVVDQYSKFELDQIMYFRTIFLILFCEFKKYSNSFHCDSVLVFVPLKSEIIKPYKQWACDYCAMGKIFY